MGLDFSKVDGLRLGELAQVLENETAQSAAALLAALRARLAENGFHFPSISLSVGDLGRLEWTSLIRQSRSFVFSGLGAAVLGQNTGVEIFNQAGSGIRVLVFAMAVAPAGLSEVFFYLNSTTETAMTLQVPIPGLLVGQAGAIAHVRQSSIAAVPPPGSVAQLHRAVAGAANAPQSPPSPMGFICELPEGTGLQIFDGTQNEACRFTLMYAEVPGSYQ